MTSSHAHIVHVVQKMVVLLPVYNGSRFLRAQLDSILTQSFQNTLILCRDDASQDNSAAILAEYAARYPGRIQLVHDTLGNLGARGSFSRLMEEGLKLPAHEETPDTNTYFALADQDDTWHPEKLAVLLDEMLQLENGTPDIPCLVHGDLRVVDQDGREIAPSMATYQGLRADRDSLAAQLISNTVTGCTALLNRSLVVISSPVPADSIMHDWWISLVASAFGRRRYVKQPLVNYRQHDSNTIGAKEWTERNRYRMKPGLAALPRNTYHVLRVLAIVSIRLFNNEHSQAFQANALQARTFLRYFAARLTSMQRLSVWMACGLGIPFPPLQRALFRLLRTL